MGRLVGLSFLAYVIIVSTVAYKATCGRWPDLQAGAKWTIAQMTRKNLSDFGRAVLRVTLIGCGVGLLMRVAIEMLSIEPRGIGFVLAQMISLFAAVEIDGWWRRRQAARN